jgi:4-amino-4-deoxy-L-arabinose transferase-like glycosyltransferase
VAAREEDVTERGRARRAGARPAAAPRSSTAWLGTLAFALAAGALYAIRLDVPAFFDNEGRYADVANEMLLMRDWVTPHIDFTLFLNKPPLLYWLTAVAFRLAGPSEWARIVSVAAAVVAIVATSRLGAVLYDEATGLLGGALLATTFGFGLEARVLRPDGILIATVALAVLCWARAERADPARRTRWLVGLYAALGTGVLAKGLPPVIVAGLPIGVAALRAHGWRGVGRLRPGLGLAVAGAIVLPWHVVVALRHPGFAWDYVVNQHLLFFLDKKLPRDSEGDTLGFFWFAFAMRSLPWIALVPLTAREAVAAMRAPASHVADGSLLLWTWVIGLLLFFSVTPSRLEHYSLPALPAVALLAARGGTRVLRGDVGRPVWLVAATALAAIGFTGLLFVVLRERFFAGADWMQDAPQLASLIVPAGVVLLLMGAAGTVGAVGRRGGVVLGAVGVGTAVMLVIVTVAQAGTETTFSWRPMARAIAAQVPPTTSVVFEAPQEYQIVGGLVFYTGRRITLLAPPGFVPPTYLATLASDMFLPRAEFMRRWQAGEPLAFVSDSQQHRETPDGLVPPPYHVLAHIGDRWLLTNAPAAD